MSFCHDLNFDKLYFFLAYIWFSYNPAGVKFWTFKRSAGVVVGGLGWQKMWVYSYAYMLICSLLSQLYAFQFFEWMP